jgi:hypothetical protein
MAQSLPLRRCAEGCLAAGATTLHIDLSLCTYLDSTFLGTLLRLRHGRGAACQTFALLTPSIECLELLRKMRLDCVLPIGAGCAPPGPWTELGDESADVDAFQRTVVQAHQQLAELPGPAGEPFRAVARLLTKEMEAR